MQGKEQGIIPQKTQKGRVWFRNMQGSLRTTRATLLRQNEQKKQQVSIGDMVFFAYSAKGKDILPFWDAFPLIFPFDEASDYFLGINMHYIPPTLRARLMDQLYTLQSDKKFDEKTRIKLSYNQILSLSKSDIAKPAIKKYLKSNVRSPFIKVNSEAWDIALFLPVQNFKGAQQSTVWAESFRKKR